jgi:two-component system, sensor histidine kinase and response regulator
VIDTIPVCIFWKDLNSVYLGCNRIFALDAGRQEPGDLIGNNDYNMGWKQQADLYREDDQKVMASGIAKINYEEPQDTPDGKQIWLRTTKVPLRDQEGHVMGILGTYEDITERKALEERIRESEERYRNLFSSHPEMAFPDANIQLPATLLGQKPFEKGVSGQSFESESRCFHPEI